MKVGILALQGDYYEHAEVLKKLDVEVILAKNHKSLLSVDGLIIPGGESTTISRLIRDMELYGALEKLKERGVPVFGTCAGLIIMASNITNPGPNTINLRFLDITVERNAYGHQRESFESDLDLNLNGQRRINIRGVFIRAPQILETGPDVEVLSTFKGKPVLVKQGKFLGSTFHPELSGDPVVHQYFLDLMREKS